MMPALYECQKEQKKEKRFWIWDSYWDEAITIVQCVSVYLCYHIKTGKSVAATYQLVGIKVFIPMRSQPRLPQIKCQLTLHVSYHPYISQFRSLIPSGDLAKNGILTWFNKIKMNSSCQGRVQINSGQVVKKIILIQFLSFDLF